VSYKLLLLVYVYLTAELQKYIGCRLVKKHSESTLH